jgi:hypothetical protein
MIFRHRFVALLAFAALAVFPGRLRAAAPLPQQFELPVMHTSIYIGSVKLTTSTFTQTASTYTATYEARVSPWSWWNETGSITLTVNPDDYDRLVRGESIEITGEATNDRGKLRQVSARAQPIDATTGKIKVRIAASGTTLIFNTTYLVKAAPASAVAAAN